MASPVTLYRFRLNVSDVDRNVYENLDFRLPMHPSENEAYLLCRVLAYALNYENGLEFSAGLSNPDDPALYLPAESGGIRLWIDIGNPSVRRLHKAAKAARLVRIYTYKDPENLKREAIGETIHRAEEIEIFSLSETFLNSLTAVLKRDNDWGLIRNEGELVVTVGEETLMGTLARHFLRS